MELGFKVKLLQLRRLAREEAMAYSDQRAKLHLKEVDLLLGQAVIQLGYAEIIGRDPTIVKEGFLQNNRRLKKTAMDDLYSVDPPHYGMDPRLVSDLKRELEEDRVQGVDVPPITRSKAFSTPAFREGRVLGMGSGCPHGYKRAFDCDDCVTGKI